MIDCPETMSCQQFQSQLPELIGSGSVASTHPHLQHCELCKRLMDDLESIAEAARQLLPIVDPSERLWDQIESAIRSEPGPPITR
jgi:hypothetical protein